MAATALAYWAQVLHYLVHGGKCAASECPPKILGACLNDDYPEGFHPYRIDDRGRDYRHPRGHRDPRLPGLHHPRTGHGRHEPGQRRGDRRGRVLRQYGLLAHHADPGWR